MPARLQWQPVPGKPRHFIAHPEGGKAQLWYDDSGINGPPGWRMHLECGKSATVEQAGADRQAASDRANAAWASLVEQEAKRIERAEADARLIAQLEAAVAIGGDKSPEPFDIAGSSSDRLRQINWHLRERGWLLALKPLAEAVSAELFRRRVGSTSR